MLVPGVGTTEAHVIPSMEVESGSDRVRLMETWSSGLAYSTSCGRKGGEGVRIEGGELPAQGAESLGVIALTRNSSSVVT